MDKCKWTACSSTIYVDAVFCPQSQSGLSAKHKDELPSQHHKFDKRQQPHKLYTGIGKSNSRPRLQVWDTGPTLRILCDQSNYSSVGKGGYGGGPKTTRSRARENKTQDGDRTAHQKVTRRKTTKKICNPIRSP